MNPFRKVLCGLLFTTHIIYAAGASAETPTDAGTGSIAFRDSSNHMCSMDLPDYGTEKIYRLLGDDGNICENLISSTRSWSLSGLPSATSITLSSDEYCENGSTTSVVITLKTIEKRVTTPIRELKVLGDYAINGIVDRGLQLKSRQQRPGWPITDSIKCMIIKTPTQPPVPPSSTAP
ncbi:hypothetical protein [Pseudomonas umsongensis]|jgi:hypothetical protein|uniref:hypothetical protein n=1 Tax=Pseudomonas umsongensis TaxID=198618 RepID=UPI0015BB0F6A|nr:hypothetical protein [Pseudomonas umsongensis]